MLRTDRIVAFAYACEPQHGSEPGVGWIWSKMLAEIGPTLVITRSNNRSKIEAGRSAGSVPENLVFEYVDLPSSLSSWKRGRRGLHLYYVIWQLLALRVAMRHHRKVPFTAAWHLTLANAWVGSFLCFLPVPFIYGPVAGGLSPPWRLVPTCGVKGSVYEIARGAARTMARFANPLARLSWWRATLILVQNPETRDWLPQRHREKCLVFPNTVMDRYHGRRRPSSPHPPTAVYAGNLLPLKGVALAIHAIANTADWNLTICGSGWDGERLKNLVARHGLEGRINFTGRVPRSEVMRILRDHADVLLFPSLHEEGGWAVMEAMAAGVPVVAFRRGGPGVLLSDLKTTVDAARLTPREAAHALALMLDPASRIPGDVMQRRLVPFERRKRVEELRCLLRHALVSDRRADRSK